MKYVAEIGTGGDPDWGIAKVKKGDHCYFVEPNPHQFIKRQIAVKDLDPEVVTLCNFAVSNAVRTLWFNALDEIPNAGHAQIVPTKYRTPAETEKGKKISRFLTNAILFNEFLLMERFDEIRLDIEGAEGFIFDDVIIDRLPDIMHVEFHSEAGENYVSKKLKRIGYAATEDRTHKIRPYYTFRRK